jgi:D-sedoheptulose 7-phosphate isomerase
MDKQQAIFDTLYAEHPTLAPLANDLRAAFDTLLDSFARGGTLLLCGNGGSACDCEHIAGELMKGFLLPRKLSAPEAAALAAAGDDGTLANTLQRALPTLVLHGLSGMSTAFMNDVNPALTFAQQAFAYARAGDVLWCISTSGNALNVRLAAIAARARGAKVIGLTGETGGLLAVHCDVCIRAPQRETWRVQELHLPIYHALCAALEAALYGEAEA